MADDYVPSAPISESSSPSIAEDVSTDEEVVTRRRAKGKGRARDDLDGFIEDDSKKRKGGKGKKKAEVGGW